MPKEDELSPDEMPEAFREAYDAAAELYVQHIEHPESFNSLLERPAMLTLLGKVKGQRALDLCCGDGFYARHCARQGAELTAVDVSQELIGIGAARAKSQSLQIRYIAGEAVETVRGFPHASFDGCVCGFGLHFWDLEPLFRDLARALVPAGWFLFSAIHPVKDRGRWQCDDQGRIGAFVRDYFEKRTVRGPWPTFLKRFKMEFAPPAVFRPLEDYTEALFRAGFLIERLLEPRLPIEYGRASAERHERLNSIPCILIMRALKGD